MKWNMKPSSDIDHLFVKLPLSVLRLNKLTFGGREVQFSLADKVVYSYFLSKIKYYCWERGGEYFDTQEDISKSLGTDVQVVRRSINKLIDYGVLKADKIRYKGRWKWKYTNIETLTEIEEDIDEPF